MTTNFALSDDFISNFKSQFNLDYDHHHKSWIFSPLEQYNQVFNNVKERFETKGVEVVPIPQFIFSLLDDTTPFSDNQQFNKPRLSQLPQKLLR